MSSRLLLLVWRFREGKGRREIASRADGAMVTQTQAMVAVMALHAMGNAFLLRNALFPLLEEDSSAMVSLCGIVIMLP